MFFLLSLIVPNIGRKNKREKNLQHHKTRESNKRCVQEGAGRIKRLLSPAPN